MEEALVKRLVVGLAIVVASACVGANVQTANYANMTEAQVAVEQGLMPAGLPRSAFELRAAYVPGSHERWGLFNFRAEGTEELRALIAPEEITLTGIRCTIPPRIEWWPVQLRKALDDERVKATGAKAYRSKSGEMIFVVNWGQGRAYYFTPG